MLGVLLLFKISRNLIEFKPFKNVVLIIGLNAIPRGLFT